MSVVVVVCATGTVYTTARGGTQFIFIGESLLGDDGASVFLCGGVGSFLLGGGVISSLVAI